MSIELEELRRDRDAARAECAALRSTLGLLQRSLDTLQKAFTDQKEAFDRLIAQHEKLQKQLFGRKSEKMPPPKKAIAKADGTKPSREQINAKRAARAKARDEKVPVERTAVPVSPEKRSCPCCGSMRLKRVGDGRTQRLIEYVPPRFVYEDAVLETLACPCGDYIVTADAPPKPFEQSPYGPRFIAHVIVSKLLDAMPHYRLEKALARQGLTISRQTMTDLLHRAAESLEPLVARLFARIATADLVQADETTMRRQDTKKRGYLWSFLAELEGHALIGYRFSPDRSQQTPVEVLGDSTGFLLADQYSGYGVVTAAGRRRHAGCWAHARRPIFEQARQHPELEELLEAILDLYRVEYQAEALGILGTDAHLAMRRVESFPIVMRIRLWIREHAKLHPPRSAVGQALRYIRKNFRSLMTFLRDPRVHLDNNRSENALRIAALIRKNSLFVGHQAAGENLAVLLSLVMSCVANDVNPEDYLANVLLRVHTHPASSIDELLPHRWRPAA